MGDRDNYDIPLIDKAATFISSEINVCINNFNKLLNTI